MTTDKSSHGTEHVREHVDRVLLAGTRETRLNMWSHRTAPMSL